MRAAEYVRMSTEHQQYSMENQEAIIREYARQHGFRIVQSYSDAAKSGIDLKHRPALRQLLRDVAAPDVGFKAILVYDVSRWGRFQDTDESAFHEFWCKQFGIHVHYCAEPFPNDNSVASSLLKTLKRTMAGEYLRELSARVHAGQCRLARKGFKLGGHPGLGLQRLLLDSEGKPKMTLATGERKSILTDRVTYVAGPSREVRLVHRIYSLFLDRDFSIAEIVRQLNRLKIAREVPGRWNHAIVRRILSHPKYVGSIVFNQTSTRLGSRAVRNPRDRWVIQPGSFAPIVSKQRFEQAQEKLRDRVFMRTDERLLADLAAFAKDHGRVTSKMLLESKHMPTVGTFQGRFGSLHQALVLANWKPPENFSDIDNRRWLKLALNDSFAAEVTRAGYACQQYRGRFRSPEGELIVLDVALYGRGADGRPRWLIRLPLDGGPGLAGIAQRLAQDNRTPMDYVFFPSVPANQQRFCFTEDRARSTGVITDSLQNALELLTQNWRSELKATAAQSR